MNEDDHAPSFESLRNLAGMLPKMVKGIKHGAIGGKGLKQLPTKSCVVCGCGFDLKWKQSLELGDLQDGFCPSCDQQLKGGCIALTDGAVYAIITAPEALKDKIGQVLRVSSKVMLEIKVRHAEQKAKSNGH